ncbi:class I SAM-dependent DNA methyltransferase [Aliiroseovarius lamellibrachiae]|uniref:class I SAM-dependent DNA methyltransferase n=1 Tax=Aliiroseovarius lamellibrachiae TaxID=1924933 RepID=UPI001BDFA033|nr:class I SAM-dependent methyltransferase [Aliiroseovarius lamellibrachiae]MBT2131407.1 methyltransferase domain-containing protein [Aliiroseovarius lamellibrachiae]
MSADPKTLAVYDAQVAEYEKRVAQKPTPGLTEFVTRLPPGGHILDLGCGPGSSAVELMEQGFSVDATDGSAEMVARAAARGVTARQALFHEITGDGLYDGIWANFSLLHLPRAEMPEILSRLRLALKPDGVFHIGLKLGKGEARDRLGRFYTYYQEDELTDLLTRAGFAPFDRIIGAGTGLDGQISDWIVLHAEGATDG